MVSLRKVAGMFFFIAVQIIVWIIFAVVFGGFVMWLIMRERVPCHKLNINVVSAAAVWNAVKSEDLKISYKRKACTDLQQTAIIVRNIGRKDIGFSKTEEGQFIKIEMKKGTRILDCKITDVSSGTINPVISDDKKYSADGNPTLMVFFDALNKKDMFKVIILHDEATSFNIDAGVPGYMMKIKGCLKRGEEAGIQDKQRRWSKGVSLIVGLIVGIIMFFVGYGGFILFFEEALTIAVPSFIAAYLGMERFCTSGSRD